MALDLNSLEEFEFRINRALQKIGEHTGVSRVYIFEDSNDGAFTNNTYEWCNSGIEPQIGELQDIPYEMIPSWKMILTEHGRVYSENIMELPDDVRSTLEPQGIRSIIVYPIYVQGRFFGFTGFDECARNKQWSKSELELLRAVSGIIANAYERKQMEATLENERDKANEANLAKSRFLANMSHEIRTPMNAVLGFTEALAQELETPRQKKMLESIRTSGNLLLSLLNDILDLSKIEAGKMTIVPKPAALKSMLNDIEVLFSVQAAGKGINLSVNVSDDVPDLLVFDEVRIKQVIFNLLGNAIKFTRIGDVNLNVSYVPDDQFSGELRIGVDDTGAGIPEKDLERIFEPFVQQSGLLNRDYEGAGLGLSVCKRLIEQMNGTIKVYSKVGVGSSFNVTIPGVARGKKKDLHQVLPGIKGEVFFRKGSVMMVDDVSSNLNAMEALIEGTGLEVVHAGNGETAIRLLNHITPDVIFLDTRMPGLDGYEVATCIKRIEALQNTKIIACTASVANKEKLEQSELFDDYLYKPVSRHELISMLGKYLEHTVVEDNAEIQSTDDKLVISGDLTKMLPELISEMEGPLTDLWREIDGSLVLFRIEGFAAELQQLFVRYPVPQLQHYVNELNDALEIIALDQIRTTVSAFPNLITQIKTITVLTDG